MWLVHSVWIIQDLTYQAGQFDWIQDQLAWNGQNELTALYRNVCRKYSDFSTCTYPHISRTVSIPSHMVFINMLCCVPWITIQLPYYPVGSFIVHGQCPSGIFLNASSGVYLCGSLCYAQSRQNTGAHRAIPWC